VLRLRAETGPYYQERRNPTTAGKSHAPMIVIAATELEVAALRRELRHVPIVKTGVGLASVRAPLGELVVSCGLAGGLRDDLPTGTVLIPREVRRPDGGVLECDRELVDAFAEGARALGIEPVFDPMVTASAIVTAGERADWAARGYAGVDMETGRLDVPRVAAVRVVLDTPQRELSKDWERPVLAMLKPWNWPQAVWLAREAPRAARVAARVVAQGIGAWVRITGQW
jgi:hypothetical protein